MNNKQPLWKQTFDKIKHKIDTEYNIGDLIPGEHELSEEFKVSRITIRRALDDLSNAGLIKRERGKGTVVIGKEEKLQTVVKSSLNSLREHEVRSRNLEIIGYEDVSDTNILNFFGLENGRKILKVIRSSRKNSKKIATYITYINPIVNLSTMDDFSGSLYKLLDSKGYKITRFSETITTNISTEEEEKNFNTTNKIAILKRQRRGYNEDTPIEYTTAMYNGEEYSMVVESDIL